MADVQRSSPKIEETDWGRLEWYASGELGNSTAVTVGLCEIAPGRTNGRHRHPNCTEILTVERGSIIHYWNDEQCTMQVGDVISIPRDVPHSAENIGREPARLFIVFDSPCRETERVGL